MNAVDDPGAAASDPRLVAPEIRQDDVPDATLRPQYLSEFVGQAQARANLKVFIEAAPGRARNRSTMCSSSGRRASARRRSPRSSRASSA